MSKYPNDYISRQQIIDYANNSRVGIDANDIARFPAADVRENVKGEWVFEKGDMVTCCDGWYCSHCKRGFHTNVPYFKDFNFCPWCGAEMEANDG